MIETNPVNHNWSRFVILSGLTLHQFKKKLLLNVFSFLCFNFYTLRGNFLKTSLPKESMNGLDIHEATIVTVHNNFIVIARLENHM